MKFLFLSELPGTGKVPRDYNHMRTEFAQMCALNADCFPIQELPNYGGPTDYDHVVLLISKTPLLREYILKIDLVWSLDGTIYYHYLISNLERQIFYIL